MICKASHNSNTTNFETLGTEIAEKALNNAGHDSVPSVSLCFQ